LVLANPETFELAKQKGNYVLIDFWATWCGPCLEETPHLKSVWADFGQDERFVMIGLSLDESPEEPAALVKANGMSWPQGFLGNWDKAPLPSQFGVRGIPSIWLIGPDGNVVARDLRGTRIKEAVAQALGRR
jgi:thiol-disulfide isomerase/thioredoxin